MPEWIVSLPDRLDVFLSKQEGILSRAKAQATIEGGHVLVNDEVTTKAAERLQEGDKVELRIANGQLPMNSTLANGNWQMAIPPVDLHLTILYEDSSCIVINKPAGIAVHPGAGMSSGEVTMLDGVEFLFEERSLHFSSDSILVHRLDKETTGCLLIAKSPAAHLALQKQFADRTVEKHYLALVAGLPSPAEALIDAPIGRNVHNRTKMSIIGSTAPREAQTTYRTLRQAQGKSGAIAVLECQIHTGRTHQVRVHLSTIGHPVLGDATYTSELSERLTQEYDIRSLCLHAWKLSFVSSADQKEHAVMAPLPQEFKEVLKRVGIEWGS